jgi:hypothetical protein
MARKGESVDMLIGLASDMGLGEVGSDGTLMSDAGAVTTLAMGQGGMTSRVPVWFFDSLGVELTPMYMDLSIYSDELIDECITYGVGRVLIDMEGLTTLQESGQNSFCEEELFDHDVSPSLYTSVDRDDLARVVELQIYIRNKQTQINEVQDKMAYFEHGHPIPKEAWAKWVALRKTLISQRVTAIGAVQAHVKSRGHVYASALWRAYFDILGDSDQQWAWIRVGKLAQNIRLQKVDWTWSNRWSVQGTPRDLEVWLTDYLSEDILNTYLTRGEVTAEFDDVLLRSTLLNRGEDLGWDYLRQVREEEAIIQAPFREWELPYYRTSRKCGCHNCQETWARYQADLQLEGYIRSSGTNSLGPDTSEQELFCFLEDE